MAGETIITVVGNLTADPELRYTQGGLAVANFTIASTPRTFDRQANDWKDGEALFLRASVWREFAENVAGTLTKGSRVIATGRLKQRSYETKEGEKRTSIELEIDEIGPSLRYATAQVTRASGGGGRGQAGGGQGNGGQIGGGQGGFGGGGQGGSGNAGGNRGGQAEEPWAPSAPAGGDVWSTPGSYNDETPF
ncbi:single-stranded DNA-binding protein [Rathayibacter sp. AY1E9]|jgi:single-strand DNA-binding protein|uniref:single-stranded DNA-binding protein n=1 Tax=unclassified Rathayibacter TaxID=2609250 RepID=UPI000CE7605F|nr:MULTISPECIES: single-stranded DNA-binding protein [unclassified Rathayibacter]PPF11652.1 single-stranded DNA-binding protein [Rathayibacter sp. AY1A5]PPF18620.1 single-stranded DNA-binding protein [Rathayibacter sp. AY1A4]PPF21555.1 single-stranded DNA-binding protein [Rathayibacter sp. AY1A7]PPF39397.1 single-stranded DNA-binding protein [Rathayibacter sp. AY1A2]PPF39606.1 single-stranded DNA-binding protein [Rathayibacter sp. AY1A3]